MVQHSAARAPLLEGPGDSSDDESMGYASASEDGGAAGAGEVVLDSEFDEDSDEEEYVSADWF